MKETGYSFSFTSLYWLVWLPQLLEWVFFSCVSGFRLKFSRIALWRKLLQLDSKSDLATNGLILDFLLENGFFRQLHSCMDWNLRELLNCCSFLTTSIFLMFSLRGILVCSLKMLLLFSHRILHYGLISFRNAMQLYFLSFCVFQPIFLGRSGKTLWLLLKTK